MTIFMLLFKEYDSFPQECRPTWHNAMQRYIFLPLFNIYYVEITAFPPYFGYKMLIRQGISAKSSLYLAPPTSLLSDKRITGIIIGNTF